MKEGGPMVDMSKKKRTNGTPQYVHQQISGLSVLIKILG